MTGDANISDAVGTSNELHPITVVVPTFRREDDATEQARRFASMSIVARVIVIDQASTLATHGPFRRLLDSVRTVELVEQPNLGGSGGYARGMLESLTTPEHAVFLSDDDAQISEESLRRMVTYQTRVDPTAILGTGMFSAEEPTLLISHGEAVRPWDFMWGPVDGVTDPIDTAGRPPEEWTFLKAAGRPNYTGWWGTLLPPGIVAKIGLPAPYFLKWDDAEYGLRATRAGYNTVVLPGAAVWHPTWSAHGTQMSWTARILHRNRLATAAAYQAGKGVIASSLVHQFKHILSGHHLTATLWQAGIDQFLMGPGAWLGVDLSRARADGQEIVDRWNENADKRGEALRPTEPTTLSLLRGTARSVANLVRPAHAPRVVYELPAGEVTWRTTLGADAVIILAADGSRSGVLFADGRTGRRLLMSTLRQHWRLARRWRQLSRSYHRALPKVTTERAWVEMIAAAEEAERAKKDE